MPSVDITFYGTVYNSVKYIKRSLTSIAETALELKKRGITAEVIIVDNYSTDGTWEIMNKIKKLYAEKGVKLRLVRYRCSRGLGRNIALQLARGKYLFFIDLDLEYNPRKLAEIINHYIANRDVKGKCFYIFLTPKSAVLSSGGIRDLNRTEDIEFCARLVKQCVMLPVLNANLRPISFNEFMREIDVIFKPEFFIKTYTSERRYAKDLISYTKRELRNKLDMICGMGYTWRKIIYEALFLHRLRGLKAFLWILYHSTFYVMAKALRREIGSYHNIINNGALCDVAMFLNYIALVVNLVKYGTKNFDTNELRQVIKKILMSNGKDKAITYFLSFEPEALRLAFKGQYFTLGAER